MEKSTRKHAHQICETLLLRGGSVKNWDKIKIPRKVKFYR